MPKFKTGEARNQITLFPQSINEYIPDNHLAKLVLQIVSSLNLNNIINKFSDSGQRGYSPKILISILFYGYSIGIRSSRKLSKACEERIDFMFISAKLCPSYKTISEFRKNNLQELMELFQDIILIGIKLGLAKIGNIKVSIDGTKIRANASSKQSKNEKGLEKLLSDVKEKVEKIMKEAEETDQKENLLFGNKRGDELPKELQKLEDRKEKIKKSLQELKKEKDKLKNEIIKKKVKNKQLSKTDNKILNNKKTNLTDSDTTFMKEREGCIKTNYNSQASVEEENQFILACDVTNECNDKKQLIPMIEQTENNIKTNIDMCKADSGYHSADNLHLISDRANMFIDDPNKKRVNNEKFEYDKVNFKYDSITDSYICPKGKQLELLSFKKNKQTYKCNVCNLCSAKSLCAKKSKYKKLIRMKNEKFVEINRKQLLSENGIIEYKKRMHTVEPVFGNIKFNLGFRQFLLRGLSKVKGEFSLMCIAHNLKKIASYCYKNNIKLSDCVVYV